MFVQLYTRANAGYKAIATLVTTALVLWLVGVHMLGAQAHAAPENVTNFSDLLTTSAPSTLSSHTITFTLPNGAVDNDIIHIEFENTFSLAAADFEDVDVTVGGVDQTVTALGTGADWGATVSPGNNWVILTVGSGGVASSTQIVVELGAVAQFTDVGVDFITNPSATTTSHTVDILASSTIQDYGQTRVAISDQVLVTASIPTRFDFVVNGTPSGFIIPGVATTTATTTSSSQLPFGQLNQDTVYTLAHQLNVTTNAANGFIVTVQQSQDLQSSTGAVIDSFTDGTYVDTPTAWAAPGDDINNDATWGHWGMTSDDDDYNAGVNDRWIAASTSPRTIFQHASSSDGLANDVGSTTIGYAIEVTPLQEAGNDYNTTLTYIATPTF